MLSSVMQCLLVLSSLALGSDAKDVETLPLTVVSAETAALNASFGGIATTLTHTTTLTSTTTANFQGVVECLNDTRCASCIRALNTSTDVHTPQQWGPLHRETLFEFQRSFFEALYTNPNCSAAPAILLQQALQELHLPDRPLRNRSAVGHFGMLTSDCLMAEYYCFENETCRDCLYELFSVPYEDDTNNASNHRATILNSSHQCAAIKSSALINQVATECYLFTGCTFAKKQCMNSTECNICLGTLRDGDGAAASQQCSTEPQALLFRRVVHFCMSSSSVGCAAFNQMCDADPACQPCFQSVADHQNANSIARAFVGEGCKPYLQDMPTVNWFNAVWNTCPNIQCFRAAVECMYFDKRCIECLANDTYLANNPTTCANLTSTQYNLDVICRSCPDSVFLINHIVFATSVIGGISAAVCILVTITILAYGHDVTSMRDRVVIGLLLSNALYSAGSAVPVHELYTDINMCGEAALSFEVQVIGRACWFCGKYGILAFEWIILATSIQALLRGSARVAWVHEAAMYMVAVASAVTAFVVFYVQACIIHGDGYNHATQQEAFTNAYDHTNPDDELDDTTPAKTAAARYDAADEEYNELVRRMLIAWAVLFAVALALWVVLRTMNWKLMRALRIAQVNLNTAQATDEWKATRSSQWQAERLFLEAQKQAFADVARPMELYIFVFVIFGVPAIIMSTPYCENRSGAITEGQEVSFTGSGSAEAISYGTCDVWCELVLAFRSLGTVMVFLLPAERRTELFGVRTTFRKLCQRVLACCRGASSSPYSYVALGSASDDNVELSNVEMSLSDGAAWKIGEDEISREKLLAEGAFGTVWQGSWRGQAVAIKVLFAEMVDEDGDTVDDYASDDFMKECHALQCIDSPHLLKFYGFGITSTGSGFIVTELMTGGSLEHVLHDLTRELRWSTRASYALQVALGMEHLHKKHILHRDLKSANVVLNDQGVAKVCDFGLSRVIRPARTHYVYSPFTGVVQHVPALSARVTATDASDSVLSSARSSFSNLVVTIEGLPGSTMTKAVGSILWMSPEVFRGDQNYGPAVDVYSFGMVLWELTTRKIPWYDIRTQETEFFLELNRALQSGRRPTIPDDVVARFPSFVAVLEACWAGDPADRPDFSHVANDLAAFLREF